MEAQVWQSWAGVPESHLRACTPSAAEHAINHVPRLKMLSRLAGILDRSSPSKLKLLNS